MKRLVLLDGIRGSLSLYILLGMVNSFESEVAIDISYFLSGFLVTVTLFKQMSELWSSKKSFQEWVSILSGFFLRRISKLLPPLAAVGCILHFGSPKFRKNAYAVPIDYNFSILKMITFQDIFPHIWPIFVTVFYYLVIPYLTVVSVIIPRPRAWIALLFLSPIVFELGTVRRLLDGPASHIWTFLCANACGVFYCRYLETKGICELPAKRQKILDAISFACLFWIIAVSINPALYSHFIGRNVTHDHIPFTSLPTAIFILKELLYPGPAADFFQTNLFCTISKISYSLYLVYPLVKTYTESQKYVARESFMFILHSLVVGTLLYVVFELPHDLLTRQTIQNLQKRIISGEHVVKDVEAQKFIGSKMV
jgi:peptidoglycan/LPS O-acetylase OafA/YrhL